MTISERENNEDDSGRPQSCSFSATLKTGSSKADLFPGYNQNQSLEAALVAGYCGLILDSCLCNGSFGETLQGLWKGEEVVSAR